MTRVAVLAVLVLLGLAVTFTELDRRVDRWEQRAADALQASAADRRRADSAIAESQREKAAELVSRAAADSLTHVVVGLRARAQLLGRLAREVPVPDTCRAVATAYRVALDSTTAALEVAMQAADSSRHSALQADAAFLSERRAAAILQTRGDSLAAVLGRMPGPCRFLGIPCPVVGAGAILGTSGGVQAGVFVGFPLRL